MPPNGCCGSRSACPSMAGPSTSTSRKPRRTVWAHTVCASAQRDPANRNFFARSTLGMIAAHPPDTLNLVLVDFKGGASFLGIRARTPRGRGDHQSRRGGSPRRTDEGCAGRRNNQASGTIEGGGQLRQHCGVRRARAERTGLAPLPALFIVVDEFSELLTHHPDFIDLFIAIGRLGRSLGMHLLLASQRMDEGRLRGLESHLSYRVCLKTFSASESRVGPGSARCLPPA